MLDITSVLLDRKDNTKFWVASWYNGIQCYKNNKLFSSYNSQNIPNFSVQSDERSPRCSGLTMDKDGNTWFVQSDQLGYLSVIKKTGEYLNFKFDAQKITRKLLIDKNGYIWINDLGGNGITVFKNDKFSQPVLNQNYKVLRTGAGNGNLQSNDANVIVQDLDGKIWVGGSAGISVFYNPTNIFSTSNFDAEPIKILQDGNVELLLSKESVNAIAVDGANNKWVGTAYGGVYCFSPDGQTQLYHFTKANSPLYSDEIIDLNYNEKTGDVFIGTNLGLQSFRSIILSGEQQYKDVVAFPNPVKPNYSGTVLIKGLVDNSIVKITDVAGNLVWEIKSNGGQVEWPINNLSNERVSAGVYLVYCTTSDAEQRALTKILVIN
jgi:hypothetical protein